MVGILITIRMPANFFELLLLVSEYQSFRVSSTKTSSSVDW